MTKEEIRKNFRDIYAKKTGTIEDGDGTLVMLVMLSASWNCTVDYTKKFGCATGEDALLMEWVSISEPHLPKVDDVVFPKSFESLPVYYKPGTLAHAL